MKTGYTIKIFMPSGEPNGLRLLERPNWTGKGVAFSRTGFQEAMAREELERAGVYILVGEVSDKSSFPTLYIGEGDPIFNRLKEHNAKKDFWTSAIAFISKDSSLNKAHVQYLENRLTDLAQKTKLSNLDNANTPQPPSLTEAEIADMELFLKNILGILPLLGLSAFERPQIQNQSIENKLFIKTKDLKAEAIQTSAGFVVLKGSEASDKNAQSIPANYRQKRADLFTKELLSLQDGKGIFTEDVVFTSPSYASSIILGRNTNGLTTWKNAKGKTLKMIQIEETSQ